MAVDGSDFLALAELLKSVALDPTAPSDLKEISSRACISRAYYGCYHAALRWAKARGFKSGGARSVHQALWAWYDIDPHTQDIATTGRSLHKERCKADYKLEAKCIAVEAFLDEAAELIEMLEADFVRVSGLPTNQIKRGF